MSGHTPGPWRWSENGDCWLEGADGTSIIHVDASENTVPNKSDRAVIAAAPELLSACMLALSMPAPIDRHIVVARLKAAIAKAESEE